MNVTFWFKLICWGAFLGYTFAAIGSFGFCIKNGAMLTKMEGYSRMLVYVIFVMCHVVRFCFAGRVCSGDFIPDGAVVDMSHYLNYTGDWILTYIIVGWTLMPVMLFIMVLWKGKENAAFVLQAPK